MLKDLNTNGIYIKTMFDGYDFLQSEIGQKLISKSKWPYIIKTTYSEIYPDSKEFLDYCLDNSTYIPNPEKYSVKTYSTKSAFDMNNPWFLKDYILFNMEALKAVQNYTGVEDIKFHVCPSFNENGECDGIGFRVIDPEQVLNAFKWIFMGGNNIIYGKNTVNKNEDCYIVEGFRDYVALNELGYNVIGLGSVTISSKQEEYIKTLKSPILLLDNDRFGLQKLLEYKNRYRIATLVGTKEKDAYDAFLKNEVKIQEIK